MAEIKVTQEIIDAIGISRPNLIKMIKEGTKKGTITDKTLMIDESEVPQAFRPKIIIDETPEEKAQHSQLNTAELIKAETAKIKAEVELAIAKGERDKPEILAQKEKDLITLQQNLDKKQNDLELRENSLAAKIVELDGREQTITQREMDLNEHKRLVDEELARKIKQNDDTIAQMLEDAEQLKQSILDDKDGELLQRQGELDDLNKEVAKQKKLIADLQQEWETVIVPKQKDLKDIIDVANKYIEYHYSKAEKSKGKLQDYHYDRVNFLWDIKDKATAFLNKLLK